MSNYYQSEFTNEKNIIKKTKAIELLLDIIEEDISNLEFFLQTKNVIYINPNIRTEWLQIQDSDTMTLFDLIDYCEIWAHDLAVSSVLNKGQYNKMLLKHMRDCVDICRFVVLLTHKHIINNE